MGWVAAFWHVVNFLSPALGTGAIAAALVKLLWRRELKAVRWLRLATWAGAAGAVVLTAGFAILGRDGAMGTYAAMVVACAAALWWAGFGARHR